MAKKKITVKDVLELLNKDTKVCVMLTAYGVAYGNTYKDGMRTAADCLDKMNYNCINARVFEISDRNIGVDNSIVIDAEIVL